MTHSRAHLVYYNALNRRIAAENDHYRRETPGSSTSQPRHLSPQTMWLVLERDGYRCFCCGESVIGQRYTIWRRNRTRGDSPANLITVLGTPSTGCMERLERGDPLDQARGYILRPGQDPERIPTLRFGRSLVWLTAEGGYRFE
ncbi:MAG TPA: hypothetical protein VF070_44260 [Streptosporangiaceae bacterium]